VYPLAPVVMILHALFFPLIFLAGKLTRLISGSPSELRFIESREEVRSFLVSSGSTAGLSASRILDLGSATTELYEERTVPSVEHAVLHGGLAEVTGIESHTTGSCDLTENVDTSQNRGGTAQVDPLKTIPRDGKILDDCFTTNPFGSDPKGQRFRGLGL